MLLPADAETLLIQYLDDEMDCPVRGIATVMTERFVQVRGTGGQPREYVGAVNVHQLTVTAWGISNDDDYNTFPLAAKALAAIRSIEAEGWLGAVACPSVQVLSMPYQDPDPTTGRARYSFTVRLHLRSAAS